MTKVPEKELVTRAIASEVICFPTDTVPALAVLPDYAEKIFLLKQRPQDKPLILMAATATDLWQFVQGNPVEIKIWKQTAQKYWPGALTLVLPASGLVNRAVNPTDPTTIGLRIPNHPIALAILSQTGPLATTSANLSGEPPLETLDAIDLKFPQLPILNYGTPKEKFGSGLPSTVAKWNSNHWEILRQGYIKNLEV
jgi:L-threonylcarbamoyladenylate synthase